MVPSLLSVISNNKHQNLSLKPSSRSLLAKYGVKALILFYCVFSIKINVFINSQNVLVITIAEFQLMIKKQTRFGKKFKMPSILQIRSPSAENRGQCLKTKHIFMKPNIIKHEWAYPYITQATKINRHAESICFTLAQLNKYIFSRNKSKILAIPRCLKSKTLFSNCSMGKWKRRGFGTLTKCLNLPSVREEAKIIH